MTATTRKTARLETLYYEVPILPASGGFGEYEPAASAPSADDGYGDINDILHQIEGDYYMLTDDDVPAGVEDIRGSIRDQPEHVYAVVHNGRVGYFGIRELATWCDAQTGEGLVIDGPQADGMLEERGYVQDDQDDDDDTPEPATIEVCGNAEWWRNYGGCDGCDDDQISDYVSQIHAALSRAGYETETAQGQRMLCHGWHGTNTFARKGGGIGTFDQMTDADWALACEAVESVPVPKADA